MKSNGLSTTFRTSGHRINWIDWAKVIAIYFVVFGHTPQPRGAFLIGYICSFHMPLFMLLSGYLSKGSTDTCANLKKHWKSLIVPYIIYNLLFYPYWIVRYLFDQHGSISFFELVTKPFIGLFLCQVETQISTPVNGVTWFLAALLVMRIILNVCYRFRRTDMLLIMTAAIIVVLNIISTNNQLFNSLFLKGILSCYPFYIFGHFIKKYSLLDCFTIKNKMTSTAFFFLISISLYFYVVYEMTNGLDRILLFYMLEITSCLAVIYFCNLLDRYSSDTLIELSSGTIAIMGLHWMFIGTINFILEYLFGISNITYSWYYALLLSAAICMMIYPFIVFANRFFPPLLGKGR